MRLRKFTDGFSSVLQINYRLYNILSQMRCHVGYAKKVNKMGLPQRTKKEISHILAHVLAITLTGLIFQGHFINTLGTDHGCPNFL